MFARSQFGHIKESVSAFMISINSGGGAIGVEILYQAPSFRLYGTDPRRFSPFFTSPPKISSLINSYYQLALFFKAPELSLRNQSSFI
jgi:hypothetical protein